MSFIGGRGYFWFLLFQLFTVDAYDGTPAPVGSHKLQNVVIGGPGAWIPYPGHSLITYLGPKVLLLAIDCRAERKLGRINSEATYAKLFEAVKAYKGIEQLVILLGVPIGQSLHFRGVFNVLIDNSLPAHVVPRALPGQEIQPDQCTGATRHVRARGHGEQV